MKQALHIFQERCASLLDGNCGFAGTDRGVWRYEVRGCGASGCGGRNGLLWARFLVRIGDGARAGRVVFSVDSRRSGRVSGRRQAILDHATL